MSKVTTPWQGLFLQSYCISSIHVGQMEDDCKDAGGRATQGAVAEVDRVGNSGREQCRSDCRDVESYDSREGGVRVAPGAATELSEQLPDRLGWRGRGRKNN